MLTIPAAHITTQQERAANRALMVKFGDMAEPLATVLLLIEGARKMLGIIDDSEVCNVMLRGLPPASPLGCMVAARCVALGGWIRAMNIDSVRPI